MIVWQILHLYTALFGIITDPQFFFNESSWNQMGLEKCHMTFSWRRTVPSAVLDSNVFFCKEA